jgi:two-component system cell cycle response regulator
MGARILIVEDNPANLELMRYLLAAAGHELLLAVDGAQGLELAAGERVDVILCDLQLPDIDGFEVLRRIRADAVLRRIPVVAVTALAMVGDRDKALAAGFDGYLSKPIEPTTFARDVEAHLHRGRGDGTHPHR